MVSKLAQDMWLHDGGGAPAWRRLSQSSKNKTAERLEMLRKEKEEVGAHLHACLPVQ
jgi:hypothetical protein